MKTAPAGRWLAGGLLSVVLLGCQVTSDEPGATKAAASANASSSPGPPAVAVHPRGFHSTRELPAAAAPTRLRIPSIHVDSALDRLRRQDDGSVQVPGQWQVAGWYEGGPRPGEPGPAAILGHVDSDTGPAVFANLHELRPGELVEVDSGSATQTFRVTGTEQVSKDSFPTQQVYLPTLEPVLRLITCGGAFDHSTGHYKDNIIVSAALVAA